MCQQLWYHCKFLAHFDQEKNNVVDILEECDGECYCIWMMCKSLRTRDAEEKAFLEQKLWVLKVQRTHHKLELEVLKRSGQILNFENPKEEM